MAEKKTAARKKPAAKKAQKKAASAPAARRSVRTAKKSSVMELSPDIIRIFDTTLRDGEQSPGATMTVNEKLKIAKHLAFMGVDAIEAGFPITSEGDFEAVRLIAQKIKGPEIVGLARTLPEDIDRAWEAIKPSSRPRIHTFVATSDIHLKYKLRKTREEVLKLAVEGVKRAKGYTENVEFSAEDATRSDPAYLCAVVEAAIAAGATTVNIPDTVGYTVPLEYARLMDTLTSKVKNIDRAVISVHCHNDLGLAVANSLMAVLHGARQIECTVNGIGERAGNCSMEEVVMAVFTRREHFGVVTNINPKGIYKASRMVSNITGLEVQPNKAIVGRNAFAHEAGIHQDGVLKQRLTYEIMDARTIGLRDSELVLGKHSGRHAFNNKLKELGLVLAKDDMERAFLRFKAVADKKKTMHDADIESIIEDEIIKIPATYQLEYCHVMCGGSTRATATIALKIFGEFHEAAAIGVGPVDAVYRCIGEISQVYNQLEDFSVKSVTEGLDALGEVTVRISDRDGKIYTGRGASLDILEASAKAYVQALNKLVYWRRTHNKPVAGTGL